MAKRYFSTAPAAPKEVKVEAVKRGTISGQYGIFHMDPKGKDPLARARTVPVPVADELVSKGYAKKVGRGSSRTNGSIDERAIGPVVANRRATSIENDGEDTRYAEVFGASGADTRDTTAFASDPAKSARVDTFTVEDTTDESRGVEDNDDPDASYPGFTRGSDIDHGEDDEDAEDPAAAASTGPADDAMRQEGGAPSGDTPPNDDVDEHAGSDQGAGANATDQTGAATDQTDDGTAVTANEAGATDSTGPAPRRSRRSPPAA